MAPERRESTHTKVRLQSLQAPDICAIDNVVDEEEATRPGSFAEWLCPSPHRLKFLPAENRRRLSAMMTNFKGGVAVRANERAKLDGQCRA